MKTYRVRYTLHNEKKVRSKKVRAINMLSAFRKIEGSRGKGSAKVVDIKTTRRKKHR